MKTSWMIAAFALSLFAAALTLAQDKEKPKVKIVDNKELPQVLLATSKGDVVLELYEDQAPNTVANFVSLVEKGYYDGLKFHRVIQDFMAQGGCPKGTGEGGPGYRIKCECVRKDHKKHERGVISMAKTAEPDTGGSQFFITFKATSHLDGKHTVFGKVIKGMENVDKLARTQDEDGNPVRGVKHDVIKKASVVQKRDHEYKPETTAE